ncbi:protein-tyrosine phosphatase-like protein [Parasitella parasitica]|nr:protein-tyrosine phosphatase-like protein [Parasitella parasitica]
MNTRKVPNKSLLWLKSTLKDSKDFRQYVHQNFSSINEMEQARSGGLLYQHEIAKRNKKLNRYYNIVPFDNNCIKLTDTRLGCTSDDYINASWIVAPYDIPQTYIATQGPTSSTLVDFWRMVIEKHVPVIVCLTPQIENGIEKCGRYWPLMDEELILKAVNSNIKVVVKNIKKERKDTEADCIVRSILVEFYYNGQDEDILIEQARVTQLQFLGWPDHGVPKETNNVIALIQLTRQLQETNKPVLVHCSAGCGRTGTFCVIDSVEAFLRMGKNCLIDPVFAITDEFRKQRTTMVQAESQFAFCYKALLDFINQEE